MDGSGGAPEYLSRQVEASRLFFLEAGESDGIAVPCGGFERCRPDYRIDRDGFRWFCLEFVAGGTGLLEIAGDRQELRAGSFFVYGPGMPHRIESSAEQPLGKYFVAFHGSGAEGFLAAHDIRVGMAARCKKGGPVRRGFDMLIERGLRKSALAGPICSLLARELLLLCRDEAAEPADTSSRAYQSYRRAREVIEGEFLGFATLEAVSRRCNVEPPYLCRLFARYHDESPYQYLKRLRMEHASRMLLEEGASVGSVAAEMGFKDAFHFSRVFKSVHHVPPSRFRRLILERDSGRG